MSPLRLSIAQRSAPKPYSPGNCWLRIGSAGVPPWIHSALGRAASFAWSAVSSIVTAPAICLPVGLPSVSSNGVVAFVRIAVENGLVTIDSAPHGPVTARERMPVPSVKVQSGSGWQSGWFVDSRSGSIGWPDVYAVSAPRSLRLSWMLLRARFAVIAS